MLLLEPLRELAQLLFGENSAGGLTLLLTHGGRLSFAWAGQGKAVTSRNAPLVEFDSAKEGETDLFGEACNGGSCFNFRTTPMGCPHNR